MCTCIYIYIYIHIYTYIYRCVFIYMYTHKSIFIYTYMYRCEPEIVQFFYKRKEWLADATIPAREVTPSSPQPLSSQVD